jgi:hypothetical protein
MGKGEDEGERLGKDIPEAAAPGGRGEGAIEEAAAVVL